MFALVTGASSGLGLEYARQLALRGYAIVAVSNQPVELEQAAELIRQQSGVEVRTVCLDLTADDAATRLLDYCHEQAIQVDVLINNAGVFYFNYLTHTPMAKIERMLQLHVMNTTRMTRLFGEEMAQRGHGYILNMSSLSAWMAMPGIQCYNATKAYINNFSRSMWYELHPHGVSVLSMTPGAADTDLFGLSPKWRRIAVKLHILMPVDKMVHIALRALFRGKKKCTPGLLNRLSRPMMEHLPDWFLFWVLRKIEQFMK